MKILQTQSTWYCLDCWSRRRNHSYEEICTAGHLTQQRFLCTFTLTVSRFVVCFDRFWVHSQLSLVKFSGRDHSNQCNSNFIKSLLKYWCDLLYGIRLMKRKCLQIFEKFRVNYLECNFIGVLATCDCWMRSKLGTWIRRQKESKAVKISSKYAFITLYSDEFLSISSQSSRVGCQVTPVLLVWRRHNKNKTVY